MADKGPEPFVVDIEDTTLANENYRTTIWTGKYLQMTVMTIAPGDDIGLEVHEDHDQFIRIESGTGRVQMGPQRDQLTFDETIGDDWVALIPAGLWHNVTNVGEDDLKLYSLYGPPDHVHGATHPTKADALADLNEQH